MPGPGLHWRDSGSGPATALFLHGYPLSSAIWDAQLAAVPPGWRFLAPDLPGFGASPAPRPGITLDDYADEVVHLLDELGVRGAVVCGLSMGGYIAFRMRALHPDLMAGLVLMHTRAAPDSPDARQARYATAQRAQQEGVAPIAEAMLPRLLSEETRQRRPDVVERLRGITATATVAGVVAAQQAMAARPDSTPLLPRLDVPALVVAGEDDTLAPAAEMRGMAEAIPGAAFVLLPGAAHLSCMEVPAPVNAVLSDFLGALPGR
ncbi:MAG TPA: alpha/beta fold hydrolase, partial [Longimicrobiales bacterium]